MTKRLLFPIAICALLLTAFALRVATYDRYLPYMDYSDESNMFLFALSWRGAEAPHATDYGAQYFGWLDGYPPLYPALSVVGQVALETLSDQFLFPCDYIALMRALSVLAMFLTVAVMVRVGYRIGRPMGEVPAALLAILAALPAAINPQMLDIGNLAIPDSLIPLGCALALWGMVEAIEGGNPAWLILSVFGALVGIMLKYSLIFALWLPFCGGIVLLRRYGWRRMLPYGLVLLAMIGGCGLWLVYGYDALGLANNEANGFREQGIARILEWQRWWLNTEVLLEVTVSSLSFSLALMTGSAAYLLAVLRGQDRVNLRWLWALVPYMLGDLLLTSTVVIANLELGGYGRLRYLFPAALALSVVWGLSLIQVWMTLGRRGVGWAAVIVLAVNFGLPALFTDADLIADYRRTDSNQLTWEYTDASLPNDGAVMTPRDSRTHLIWNRPYSGFNGQTAFEIVFDEEPSHSPPAYFAEQGIRYVVFTQTDRRRVYAGDAMSTFIRQLWPLKTIVADPSTVAGETTFIYQIVPPQVTENAVFGDQIALVGYDLSNATALQVGESFTVRPYWQAIQTPQTNYSLFVHLHPADDPTQVIAQHDGAPAAETRLTVTWDDPDERLVGSDVTLTVLPETPDGDYTLALGLYDFVSGARLTLPDGASTFTIPLTILPQ
jgi:hypothetical protein